jgi:hypothetical protein
MALRRIAAILALAVMSSGARGGAGGTTWRFGVGKS